MQYKHIFGPVPSRRLGISLGVDLVPLKTCSLDCVYCECGKTTKLTTKRKEYVPQKEIIFELNHYLKRQPELDYITFSGSGEPTLHNGIGNIVKFIKKKYPQYTLALLTNTTLLGDKVLQKEIKDIDLILPSLDAVSDETFNKINRPEHSLNNKNIINGIIDFSKNYKGKIWLEIFIIPGLNDTEEELKLFKKILNEINPEMIQLNSIDRPSTETWVKKATKENLMRIKNYLSPSLPVEIIAKFDSGTRLIFEKENIENKILSIIYRRPCTIDDLVKISGLHLNELNKYIRILLENNIIEVSAQKRGNFYRIKKK
ncbi:MAG: radical SAM protein [Spirochaetes bacterium]|nr:radical SAM protein [Spirochaetota bacterium]